MVPGFVLGVVGCLSGRLAQTAACVVGGLWLLVVGLLFEICIVDASIFFLGLCV